MDERPPPHAMLAPVAGGRFNLMRRISVFSLLALLVTAIALVLLYRYDQMEEHSEIAAQINERIAYRMTSLLGDQLARFVVQTEGLGPTELQAHPEVARLDRPLAEYLSATTIKIKLYNPAGQAIYSTLHDEIGSTSRNREALDRALQGETRHKLEFRPSFRIPGDDLQDRHIIQTYLPLRHADQISGVFEVYGDITPIVSRMHERLVQITLITAAIFSALYAALFFSARRADRALTHWEDELRIAAIAFESQEGMFITDAVGVIRRVNHAFIRTTGYSASEAVGKTPSLLRSGRHDQSFYRSMRETLEREGYWQGEIWNRRKNGEIYPEWLTITAVRNAHGVVTHHVAAFNDITQRKAVEEEIKHLAFYDPLTRLPNRRLLLDRMHQALATSDRNRRHGALLFIDLDNFKNLNDTLGHDMGDRLLQQVAARLEESMRSGDTAARLGGDEFVVMLEDLSKNLNEAATQTEKVGEKILASLNHPYVLGHHEYHSTPSIGVTLFLGRAADCDELMKRADLAMYRAKDAGRNTLRFFDPEMQATVEVRTSLENDLRRALRENQFALHYQPQVDTTGRVTGAEALLRWHHPQRGMVSPAEFIPLAEETRLILPIGLWVLQTACARLALWGAHPETAHLTLAVNVSARQFRHPDFVDQVMAAIESCRANPHRLKLELTESVLLDAIEETIAKMEALKAEGVSFSLDDFGTGYSSLSYLKRLPLDQLKIDRSFIRDVTSDSNDAAIARTIVALGQSLGLNVIAEGVETEAQREFLAAHDCHAYQGYLFGKPEPAQD